MLCIHRPYGTSAPAVRVDSESKKTCLNICDGSFLIYAGMKAAKNLFSLLNLFDFGVGGFFECVGIKGGVCGELDGEALDFVDNGFSIRHMQIKNMAAFGFVF